MDMRMNRAKSTEFRLKAIEGMAASLCLGLALDSLVNGVFPHWSTFSLLFITAGGFVIINGVVIITLFFDQTLPSIASILFSLIGGLLFLVSGSDVLNFWREANAYVSMEGDFHPRRWNLAMFQLRSAGLLSIATGILYLSDALYTGVSGPLAAAVAFRHCANCGNCGYVSK